MPCDCPCEVCELYPCICEDDNECKCEEKCSDCGGCIEEDCCECEDCTPCECDNDDDNLCPECGEELPCDCCEVCGKETCVCPEPPQPGEIDYNITEIIVSGSREGFEINLTKETFKAPAEYKIAVFSINGGDKWKAVKADTFTELKKFAKLFNKDLELWISDKGTKKEKPKEEDIIKFPKISKRPKAPKLKVNYKIFDGQWVLSTDKKAALEIAAVKSDVNNGVIQVGLVVNKVLDTKGWGKFLAEGGITATTTKTTYFMRYEPKPNDNGTYTAASKNKKISVKLPKK